MPTNPRLKELAFYLALGALVFLFARACVTVGLMVFG